MLSRSRDRPELPSEQNPNSPPMSPIPGTEQIPPWSAGCRAATVTAVTGRLAAAGADAAAAAGSPAIGTPGATASTGRTNIQRWGKRPEKRMWGGSRGGGGRGRGGQRWGGGGAAVGGARGGEGR